MPQEIFLKPKKARPTQRRQQPEGNPFQQEPFEDRSQSSGIPIPEVAPEGFGSIPEYLVFAELNRRGMENGVDFQYQSRFFGSKILGAIEADFLFFNPPDLAVDIQGEFLHYEQGVDQKAKDLVARAQLAGLGITLIFIDDGHILENVKFYVGEALRYRDHSKITRGFM